MTPRPVAVLQEGQRVFLKAACRTEDDDGRDVTLPAGSAGRVTAVRACGEWPRPPRPPGAYEQGPWLYDVEFLPGGPSAPVVWHIYDAGDLNELLQDDKPR